ncbi:hypothetical protein NLJ89_g9384 [Agrocybe chaxingu]|uniref:SEC7 domain-containing protein n=1 Tax=Agrocybe chaxingu TaxID=84603 RepID=A0A9W8MTL1_9AGAR|nr:hypothetical protein NLJ89_g9384 [Agrocybe chaxingu]
MMGQSTVRERSKTDAGLHPSSAGQSSQSSSSNLMNAFAPPVPPIPAEHRPTPTPSASTSPIADVFSSSSSLRPVVPDNKPLPAIVHSPTKVHDIEDIDDRSIVFVEKMSPLPALPPPSPTAPASNAAKRRSMSVSDADLRAIMTSASSPTIRPLPRPPQTPEARRTKEAVAPQAETLPGFLDVFKGELSSLEPLSSPTLDLRDPSTPARQASYRARANGIVLSPRDPQGERADEKKSPSMSSVTDPFASSSPGPSRPSVSSVHDDSAIVPPRTSSLQSPARYSLGSTNMHAPSSRQLTPSRSRSGPSSGLVAQSQSPREANRLRVLHRSTASSSEPSLIAAAEDARVLSPHRRGSQQDIYTPESLQFSTSPSPHISSEESGDMETRAKELATRCWNEDEEFLAKEKICEWLGGQGQINKAALRHYIDFFDFAGLRLDLAFRRLCGKLYLKAETQQVDRLLEQFSRRYWDCNPGNLYGSANIVHAVSYSLLLLNTDLHVAELVSRMSRSQFVRNTMTAIQMQLQPNSPMTAARLSSSDLTYDDCSSSVRAGSDETEMMTRSKRSDSIASWNSLSKEAIMSLPVSPNHAQTSNIGASQPNGSTPSLQISNGHEQIASNRAQHGRAWESDMESLLKEMYNAIKHQQILQPINTSLTRPSVSSLSPGGNGMMRNRSLRTGQPDRLTTLKRGSIRGLQSILSSQSGISPYSSNSSIDGRVSPSPSFATSTHEAMYGSSSSFLNPTLGFASNLSHTIIREAQEDDDRSVHSIGSTSTTISISDEELALLGAPWAKEGMLCRKQYWESANKRAKDKSWMDAFVVIQKGELNMFVFGDHTSGMSGTFGGGNWLANAQPVGTIQLSHSLAHALPPPGYNKRPHCMVLTLANRGVYFFQAGTEELVNEWVSTCNYWAARTSKEPLAGGVSNMEYGWNRVVDMYGHGRSRSQTELHREPELPDSVSVRSGKSTRSKYGWKEGAATVRGGFSPRTDKTFINDWKPPMPPTVASVHDEEAQLEALRKHVESLKRELEVHNELREPMAALYLHRSPNGMKAQSNWEEKSQYLLREIVKYDLYIDSLQAAMALPLEHALSNSHPTDEPLTNSKKWKGPEELPITEEPEPVTPNARQRFQPSHQRDAAEDDDA